ncbi:MAG: hypothetical protein OHK0046_15390 [Anaerolineae bacterium]
MRPEMITDKHWCPQSENYTGGDALVAHLNDAWAIVGHIRTQVVNFPGGRQVTLYTIRLRRDNQSITMHVLSNPFVEKIVIHARQKLPMPHLVQ